MRRKLYLTFGVLLAACTPSQAKVANAPAPSVATACGQQTTAVRYVVDGKSATCASAMALSRDNIVSVEVLKGTAAALYGAAPAESVVIIRTKRER